MGNLHTGRQPAWLDDLTALLPAAPEWMRALASAELHIGGFTNVQLEHPVLDAAAAPDDDAAGRALLFFVGASLARGAAIARVQCGRGARGPHLAHLARTAMRGAIARIDDESLGLVHYFDLYLAPIASIGPRVGARIVRSVGDALGGP
jgi:hypothetical protein